MKKFILIIIALFLIPNLLIAATPSLVQSAQRYTGTSASVAFPGNVTNGNLIIVKVQDGRSDGTKVGDPTVSDTKHPYIQISPNNWGAAPYSAGSRNNQWLYCAVATSTTALTVSVTRGASGTDMGFIIEEYTGYSNSGCLDIATTSSSHAASTTWTSLAVDAPADSLVSVQVGQEYSSSNPTNQNGYTTIQHINGQMQRAVYQTFTSATSTVPWFTGALNSIHNFTIFVLDGVSSGGASPDPIQDVITFD